MTRVPGATAPAAPTGLTGGSGALSSALPRATTPYPHGATSPRGRPASGYPAIGRGAPRATVGRPRVTVAVAGPTGFWAGAAVTNPNATSKHPVGMHRMGPS